MRGTTSGDEASQKRESLELSTPGTPEGQGFQRVKFRPPSAARPGDASRRGHRSFAGLSSPAAPASPRGSTPASPRPPPPRRPPAPAPATRDPQRQAGPSSRGVRRTSGARRMGLTPGTHMSIAQRTSRTAVATRATPWQPCPRGVPGLRRHRRSPTPPPDEVVGIHRGDFWSRRTFTPTAPPAGLARLPGWRGPGRRLRGPSARRSTATAAPGSAPAPPPGHARSRRH